VTLKVLFSMRVRSNYVTVSVSRTKFPASYLSSSSCSLSVLSKFQAIFQPEEATIMWWREMRVPVRIKSYASGSAVIGRVILGGRFEAERSRLDWRNLQAHKVPTDLKDRQLNFQDITEIPVPVFNRPEILIYLLRVTHSTDKVLK